jgi:hypothetical protein
MDRYASFADFYPFYLAEHRDRTCRRLHFAGSAPLLRLLAPGLGSRNPWGWAAAPVAGYGLAWIGHFALERNRPATFRHPFYSFLGDWAMFAGMLRGRIPF